MANLDKSKRLGHEILHRVGIAPGGDSPCDITVHDDRFWARVMAQGELGLGESYQEGWWDANQLDEFMVRRAGRRPALAGAAPAFTGYAHRQGQRLEPSDDPGGPARTPGAHYDIGNDLYERMLDRRMIYSCALLGARRQTSTRPRNTSWS